MTDYICGFAAVNNGKHCVVCQEKVYSREDILQLIGSNTDLTLLRQQGNREEYKKQYYINLEKDKIRGRL